jgi:hypothetical protein
MAMLLLGAGCGSSSDSEPTEVTVQTGSLSKAEFISRADAICEASRSEFEKKIASFFKAHESTIGQKDKEEALYDDIVETVIGPNFEGEIEQISKIGAPKHYAPEVSSFLNTLQRRLDEVRDNPAEITASSQPFQVAVKAASKAELDGCAESFGG